MNNVKSRLKQAQEDEEDPLHELVENVIQVYTANQLGYVDAPPTGPRCGTCIWFEKGEGENGECMWIRDREVNGEYGCCNVWRPIESDIQEALTHIGKQLKGKQRNAEKVEEEPDEFFDLINPSQREHLQKPEGFSEDKERYIKSWEELSEEEKKETESRMKQRYEDVEGDVSLDMVKEWRETIDEILFHHFLDPDDWWLPESWELCKKEWNELSREELDEVIGTFSFRHGGVDVKHLLRGKGVFYKKPPNENHFTLVEFKKQLIGDDPSRLAAVGINFPSDKEPDIKSLQKKHQLKQQKYMNTPKTKPIQEDYNRVISAARIKIAEKKIDLEHDHHVDFFQTPHGQQRSASLVNNTNAKFVKYWILNAKQTNGNGWGVSGSTIEENIKQFEGMPFVVTAKSWVEDSIYGDEFTHPYIPTNNINMIYAHQSRYAVGTIDRIIREDDDYYAMIKMFPKYANYRPPPFCSPGIYQLDRMEPANDISKWKALHLAGLWEDPAYGAQVAIFKGTCIGTANECFIQFKGARLTEPSREFAVDFELEPHTKPKSISQIKRQQNKLKPKTAEVVCPVKQAGLREKLEKKRQQLADADGFETMTYKKSKPVHMKKRILKGRLEKLYENNNSGHVGEYERKEGSIQTNVRSEVDGGTTQERIGELKREDDVTSTIPSYEDAKIKYNSAKHTLNHQNGFTFIPHLNRAFTAPEGRELHKLFGDKINPLHAIAVTDEPGKELNDNHEKAYNKLIREGKIPTIGGYHDDQTGKDYTDIGTLRPMSDLEAKLEMTRYKQRSSGRYDLDGKFSIFNNE